ncbi:hypothetical protein [Actinoplanes sp. M2I2]|uniref:hypothetical protein n=1 Tax=Actinoplanes sp. M2I2 TaxID=1734444 RepID=UPI002021F97F|nr:hypothetical protein [Actinoplanes sp. M2I2]
MTMRGRRWVLWFVLIYLGSLAAKALNRRDDWSSVYAAGALIIVVGGPYLLARSRDRRRLRRWAAHREWSPIDPDDRQWPWPAQRGQVKVRQAWQRVTDGLPVTFAEVRWKGGAFAGMVLQPKGSGAVVVVRLPQPGPAMALHHAFQPVGDSPRLEQPALLEAYLAGDIPTWTVRGDELYTVEARDAWVSPELADQVVRGALRAVHLLDLGPDTSSAGPRIEP